MVGVIRKIAQGQVQAGCGMLLYNEGQYNGVKIAKTGNLFLCKWNYYIGFKASWDRPLTLGNVKDVCHDIYQFFGTFIRHPPWNVFRSSCFPWADLCSWWSQPVGLVCKMGKGPTSWCSIWWLLSQYRRDCHQPAAMFFPITIHL